MNTGAPSPMSVTPKRLLFVCLGNICRSPLAEGLFASLALARGMGDRFHLDSCGTGAWHAGEPPDPRTLAVARSHGVRLTHRARQLDGATDFQEFDLLLVMDRSNLQNILRAGCPSGKAALIRSFDPALRSVSPALQNALDVPDPYSGGPEGFEHMYQLLHAACSGLLGTLLTVPEPME